MCGSREEAESELRRQLADLGCFASISAAADPIHSMPLNAALARLEKIFLEQSLGKKVGWHVIIVPTEIQSFLS